MRECGFTLQKATFLPSFAFSLKASPSSAFVANPSFPPSPDPRSPTHTSFQLQPPSSFLPSLIFPFFLHSLMSCFDTEDDGRTSYECRIGFGGEEVRKAGMKGEREGGNAYDIPQSNSDSLEDVGTVVRATDRPTERPMAIVISIPRLTRRKSRRKE